ncbi:hypothetical protein [Streptomyces sp. NPDC088910]|uniref:hypothetical protein n=1 Tax=Streptomyces sp. NPDC088910 TaxID=3365911 RepID=UPI00380F449C
MTDGPGQQPQPPQEPPTSAPEGEREVLEGRVIPSRPQPRHAAAQAPPQQPSPYDAQAPQGPQPPSGPAADQPAGPPGGYADDPRRGFRHEPGQSQPQAPSSGPAWSPQAEQPGAYQVRPGVPGQGAARPHASLPPAAAAPGAAETPAAPAPPPGPAPARPTGPTGPRPAAQTAPRSTPQAPAQGAPRSPSQSPQGAPQGAPGMGTHRQPFPRQQRGAGQRRQGAHTPASGPGGPPSAGTPDWGALAEQQAASGAKRRKLMMLGGGIVAVAVIAGGVATAVVMSGGSDDEPVAGPSSATSGATSQSPLPPAPSFSSVAPPPPPNPLDFISTPAKDTAPITVGGLFPGKQFRIGGNVYSQTAAATTAKCADGARSELAAALTANGCRKLIRATYVRGGVAVTVGVAVFDDTAHAAKVQKTAHYLGPLNGGGIKDFCHAVACQMTSNAVGRYAYFTISGFKTGKTLTKADTTARQAANDASDFAFQRVIQRGRDAASAATP